MINNNLKLLKIKMLKLINILMKIKSYKTNSIIKKIVKKLSINYKIRQFKTIKI